ncbi:hypothetical protein [Bradyrhizobium sp. CCBAU 65884]|uniref:hypothetical protein n=1 Tax=Bradyrhizobium sp. CCBAU 65884 TaxID=722477 RepID=UPI0023069865|nr:hypothetical protein [Bradyrhizobium sp. CCBAU 65884]
MQREPIEDQVAWRLARRASQLASIKAKKARDAAAAELMAQAARAAELRQTLESNNAKLAETQQAQAELIRNACPR